MESKNKTRLVGMLGFAMRAGKVIIGTELICSALARRGAQSVRLVMISHTASDATKKKLLTKCEFYKKDAIIVDIESGELGRLLGKTYAPAAVAIVDDNFANEIRRAWSSLADEQTNED